MAISLGILTQHFQVQTHMDVRLGRGLACSTSMKMVGCLTNSWRMAGLGALYGASWSPRKSEGHRETARRSKIQTDVWGIAVRDHHYLEISGNKDLQITLKIYNMI